ncbi:MAG TPA: hypothetical protein VI278_02070 [Nitrososphaeraceae archaeon]
MIPALAVSDIFYYYLIVFEALPQQPFVINNNNNFLPSIPPQPNSPILSSA